MLVQSLPSFVKRMANALTHWLVIPGRHCLLSTELGPLSHFTAAVRQYLSANCLLPTLTRSNLKQ